MINKLLVFIVNHFYTEITNRIIASCMTFRTIPDGAEASIPRRLLVFLSIVLNFLYIHAFVRTIKSFLMINIKVNNLLGA